MRAALLLLVLLTGACYPMPTAQRVRCERIDSVPMVNAHADTVWVTRHIIADGACPAIIWWDRAGQPGPR